MVDNVTIIGTGLIGTSIALALREAGYVGDISAWDAEFRALDAAYRSGANISPCGNSPSAINPPEPGFVILAGPVLSILDWMEKLANVCCEDTLITDVGSTKLQIAEHAAKLGYNQPGRARFLPGHPMAGKESGGAALAEARLFHNAMWLFTPPAGVPPSALETEWRQWVVKFGARTMDLDPARHDEICAWVSHLPQMLSTALAALLEETFGSNTARREEIAAIGGRALRETTRLGASPYSMWRDIALSNTEPIAATLHALEQRLAHVRENLRTPELKEEFRLANEFRKPRE
jgi:prephenate dehydrogenase